MIFRIFHENQTLKIFKKGGNGVRKIIRKIKLLDSKKRRTLYVQEHTRENCTAIIQSVPKKRNKEDGY